MAFIPQWGAQKQGVAEGLRTEQENWGWDKDTGLGGEGGGKLWGHLVLGRPGLVTGVLFGPEGVPSCTSFSVPVTWEAKPLPIFPGLEGLSEKMSRTPSGHMLANIFPA